MTMTAKWLAEQLSELDLDRGITIHFQDSIGIKHAANGFILEDSALTLLPETVEVTMRITGAGDETFTYVNGTLVADGAERSSTQPETESPSRQEGVSRPTLVEKLIDRFDIPGMMESERAEMGLDEEDGASNLTPTEELIEILYHYPLDLSEQLRATNLANEIKAVVDLLLLRERMLRRGSSVPPEYTRG